MRKFICVFMAIAMVFTCTIFSSSAQSIDNVQLQPMPTDTSLYISTEACPDAYINYVNQNVHRFIESVSFTELTPGDTLTVGAPFAFSNEGSDIYYFPILRGSEILYTFRVFPVGDGEYSGILGRSFVDELNALAATTSAATPLRMVMEGDTVAAYVGNTRSVIFEYPDGTFAEENTALTTETATLTAATQTVVNATVPSAEVAYTYTVPMVETRAVVPPPGLELPTSIQLPLDISETQSSNSWCAAYVTAIISRYIFDDNSIDVNYVMETIYGEEYDTETALGDANVVRYASLHNVTVYILNDRMDYDLLKAHLADDRPVYLGMRRVIEDGYAYHAMCLSGYDSSANTWTVWNPWHWRTEIVDYNLSYTTEVPSSRTYIYYKTISGWF